MPDVGFARLRDPRPPEEIESLPEPLLQQIYRMQAMEKGGLEEAYNPMEDVAPVGGFKKLLGLGAGALGFGGLKLLKPTTTLPEGVNLGAALRGLGRENIQALRAGKAQVPVSFYQKRPVEYAGVYEPPDKVTPLGSIGVNTLGLGPASPQAVLKHEVEHLGQRQIPFQRRVIDETYSAASKQPDLLAHEDNAFLDMLDPELLAQEMGGHPIGKEVVAEMATLPYKPEAYGLSAISPEGFSQLRELVLRERRTARGRLRSQQRGS
ncbi:MAG: hypothetical protein WC291_09555 [Thermodesulfovibrionales bacterium]|jgi:hypothetical protein